MKFRRWMTRFSIIYLIITVVVIVWFLQTADSDVYATLLLFGPRWVALLPLALLAPLCLLVRSWLGVAACMVSAILIAGPFMGGVVNVAEDLGPTHAGSVRVMTFNADAKSADRVKFQELVSAFKPDIIALQDADRILPEDLPAGYGLQNGGNGIKLAAMSPITVLGSLSDPIMGAARGAAKFRVNDRVIGVVHLPTPRHGLEAVLGRKPGAMDEVKAIVAQRDAASKKVRDWLGDCAIVAGDFNMPVESTIYRRDWGPFKNAYSDRGLGWGWTMYSGRGAVRIDHILHHGDTASVRIGDPIGSAHRPVLADVK